MFDLEEVKPRRKSWIQASASPDTYRKNWLLDDCADLEPQLLAVVKNWVEAAKTGKIIKSTDSKSCGKGLIFYGPPGRGKSTLAVSIINEVALTFPLEAFESQVGSSLIRPVYFMPFDKFISLRGDMMNDYTPAQETLYYGILGEALNDAYNVRVLVIDDLGKEHSGPTGWQKVLLHQLIRTRYGKGLPTIITTNLPLDAWGAQYGDATESFAREAFRYLTVDSDKGDLRK